MASPSAAWGIEIGADALKAIRLERDGKSVAVSDFAYIPHKKVLTTPDLDQDEMIRISLGQFISQKSLEGEHMVLSVPGHAAFARFAKLPPVEPKKVPDIVKFEAVQQIPFPIEEVEWDYETFASDDSPEIEVGIFAITRERVQQRLGLYGELGVSPESLTLSPVSVFNALSYDLELGSESGPVIFLDIGAQATDVVIAEQGRCWIRTFPLGGTHFTEAIASAFKLSYSKAEKLKKEASTSKYAKQIMQAMRPVFSDLLADLQRSIGYYQSLHREHELTEMIGLGSTFKIPGLRKFIGQQLQINVQRLDEFRRITVGGREAAAFAEHAVNFATAYGLALQGVGLAPIDANLMPVGSLREQMWHAKTKWFAAAAAIIVAGSATALYHPLKDGAVLSGSRTSNASSVQSLGDAQKNRFQSITSTVGSTATNMLALVDEREYWPHLLTDVGLALQSVDPNGDYRAMSHDDLVAIPPRERKLALLNNLSGNYVYDGTAKTRRIDVTIDVEISHRDPVATLNETVAQWLRDHAEPTGDRADRPYRIIVDSVRCNRTQRVDITVNEDGEKRVGGSGSSGNSGRPPAGGTPPTSPGGLAPGGGAPSPGGGLSPGGGGRREIGGSRQGAPGGGLGGGLAPGGEGRRQPGGSRMGAPGSGLAGGGMSPGGLAPGGNRSGGTPARPGGGEREQAESDAALDELAPMPTRPSLYPTGTTYYQLPITFTIEIIEPQPAAPADGQA